MVVPGEAISALAAHDEQPLASSLKTAWLTTGAEQDEHAEQGASAAQALHGDADSTGINTAVGCTAAGANETTVRCSGANAVTNGAAGAKPTVCTVAVGAKPTVWTVAVGAKPTVCTIGAEATATDWTGATVVKPQRFSRRWSNHRPGYQPVRTGATATGAATTGAAITGENATVGVAHVEH